MASLFLAVCLQLFSLLYISPTIRAFVVVGPVEHKNNAVSSSSSSSKQSPFQQRRLHIFQIAHSLSSSLSGRNNNENEGDNKNENEVNRKENKQTYTVEIRHENQNATITIEESESILSALERVKNQQQSDNNSDNNNNNSNFLSSLPTLPQDCRKGNCLTCAAIHLPNSNKDSVITLDDGLAPVVRKAIDTKGHVQTCSSYVVGEDVVLGLGACHDVWDSIWDSRVNDEVGERIRSEAMAKTMRMADERNVVKWAKKTEKMLDLE